MLATSPHGYADAMQAQWTHWRNIWLDYFVDRFHFRGHKCPICRARYNPHDQGYLTGFNTSTTEQQWHWLDRYGPIVRHMKSTRSDMLLLRMAMLRNTSR
jgi:hypothetical protein